MEREDEITYVDYLALPEEKREELPNPTFTVEWADHDRLAEIADQGVLDKIEDHFAQSTTSDKIPFIEHQSPKNTKSNHQHTDELREHVASLLQHPSGLATTSSGTYKDHLQKAVSGGSFTSFLILADGEFHAVLITKKIVETLSAYLTEMGKIDVVPDTDLDALNENELRQLKRNLIDVCVSVLGTEQNVERLITSRLLPTKGVEVIDYQSTEYALFVMLTKERGVKKISHKIMCPRRVLDDLPNSSGFGARVLGWVRLLAEDTFAIHPIVIASVKLVQTK